MFLTFSDSAKYAEAARSFLSGQGFSIHHSFFNSTDLISYLPGQSWPAGFLPAGSLLLAAVFKFLPVNDTTIALVGYLFLVLCAGLVFLIAKKLHSIRAGFVAALLFASSLFFFEYAGNASTEIFFTAEILLFTYLILQKNKFRWLAPLSLLLMFLTRQQATLFLLALAAYFVFFSLKRWRPRLVAILAIAIFFTGLYLLARRDVSSIYSPLKPFYSAQTSAGVNQGLYLRGQTYATTPVSYRSFAVKVFYNVYNFVRNPDRLAPSAIFLLFIFSFFTPKHRQFTYYTATILFFFILGASASLPNARYIHPVIPLVIISASLTLVSILEKFSPKHPGLKSAITLIFLTLPTLGYFTLDARFRRQQFNLEKPPVYRQISKLMAESIPKGKLVITNLDAWAAWYEGLTTMWFPVSPNQLDGFQDKVEFIVITNYLEDDADFALGEWRDVVYTPNQINSPFLEKYYRVLKTFTIDRTDVYENKNFQGTILARRT